MVSFMQGGQTECPSLVAGKADARTTIRLVRLFEAHEAIRVSVLEYITPHELGLNTAPLLCDRGRTDCRK